MIPNAHESINPILERIESNVRSVISIHINTEKKMVYCIILVSIGDQ